MKPAVAVPQDTIDDATFERLCKFFHYTPKGVLLTNEEAAEILRCTPAALDYRRQKGGGPQYFNPPDSRRVLYAERDILAYLAKGACKSTSERSADAWAKRNAVNT